MARKTRLEKRTRHEALIEGVRKRLMGKDAITLGGKSYTPARLVAELQSLIDAMDETDRLRAAWLSGVARERRLDERLRNLSRGLVNLVVSVVGDDPVALAEFGLEPRRTPGPKTVASKLEGARKARETRALRKTMGKRRKAKVKGG